MIDKAVMLEFLYIRDSASLCDRLIQSLWKWEEVTGEKLSEDISTTLDHLLKTLRRGEAELFDMLELEEQEDDERDDDE